MSIEAALRDMLADWRRKQREFEDAVGPAWEHGDKFASRRYEGEAIALRWCCEDLEQALAEVEYTEPMMEDDK